jgi:hypothetical protein
MYWPVYRLAASHTGLYSLQLGMHWPVSVPLRFWLHWFSWVMNWRCSSPARDMSLSRLEVQYFLSDPIIGWLQSKRAFIISFPQHSGTRRTLETCVLYRTSCWSQPLGLDHLTQSVKSNELVGSPVLSNHQASSTLRLLTKYYGARGSVDGWDITLQAVRSRIQVPMRPLNFFNLPNSSGRTRPRGLAVLFCFW